MSASQAERRGFESHRPLFQVNSSNPSNYVVSDVETQGQNWRWVGFNHPLPIELTRKNEIWIKFSTNQVSQVSVNLSKFLIFIAYSETTRLNSRSFTP
jgi:hypothetical protein